MRIIKIILLKMRFTFMIGLNIFIFIINTCSIVVDIFKPVEDVKR